MTPVAPRDSWRHRLPKTSRGYAAYRLDFATREGLLPAIVILVLPFLFLWVLVKLLPPWTHEEPAA